MSKSGYLRKMQLNIKLAYIKNALHHLYFFLPIWYAFETQFVNPAALSIIYAISHLITVVLELPTGALADLMGRRKIIFFGLILEGLSWAFISQSQSAAWLWTGYTVLGISAALVSGADIALHYDSLKELKREEDYSKFSANVGLVIRASLIAGSLLGGYIYAVNTRLPYLLVGVSITLAGLLTFFNTEPKIDTEKFSLKSYLLQTKRGFKQLLKTEYIKDFSVYYVFVGGITWYFMYFLNMAFITEIGFSAIERSWVFSGVYMVAALVNIWLVRSKWVTKEWVYLALPIIMVVGFIPGYWAGRAMAVFSFLLVQFVGMARFSLLDQYANLEFESKYRATAVSSLNMSVSVFFAIIVSIGGVVIENYGTGLIMTAMGVLTLVTALPAARLLFVKYK